MKKLLFVLIVGLCLFSGCAHRDAYGVSRANHTKSKEGKDSYAGSGGGRQKHSEGRESYSSASGKISWKFWKKWKRKRRDSYSSARKRKIIKKRKPPQGIKNN